MLVRVPCSLQLQRPGLNRPQQLHLQQACGCHLRATAAADAPQKRRLQAKAASSKREGEVAAELVAGPHSALLSVYVQSAVDASLTAVASSSTVSNMAQFYFEHSRQQHILLVGGRQCLGPVVTLVACAAADVSASSTRSSSSSSSPVAVDESVEEALHIVEESLHERAAVSGLRAAAGAKRPRKHKCKH
jgi:hypothetical protein